MTAREKLAARLNAAKAARGDARKANHEEVVEEDRRAKLPKNFESRKRRAEWELQNQEQKQAVEAEGKDFKRDKALNVTVEEQDARKIKKTNPDEGFADYQQAQYRQYQRLTKGIKPDLDAYKKSVDRWGDDFTANSLAYGEHGETTREGVDRMVEDLEAQIEKRSKFSRRRAVHTDSDIDYINERNMRFNKKAERFYGKYTQELKESLERGTAV